MMAGRKARRGAAAGPDGRRGRLKDSPSSAGAAGNAADAKTREPKTRETRAPETKAAGPAEKKSGPKWRRRSDARPDEILDAALDEFVEKGFDAARVEDVAARAGLSKGAVYLYFKSKEEILRALIEREIAPIARRARALAEAGVDEPVSTLKGLIGAFTTVMSNPRVASVPKVVLSVAPRFPEIGAYYRENVIEQGIAAFTALHRSGIRKGIFRDVDSKIAARMVVGPIVVHLLVTHVLGGEEGAASAAERAETHFDLLMRGLLSDAAREAA